MNSATSQFTNVDYKSLSKYLQSLSPLEFATIGSIVGIIISAVLTNNEQNSIGNFLELVGQVILTAQAQGSLLQPPSVSENDFIKYQQYVDYKFDILIKEIKKIK